MTPESQLQTIDPELLNAGYAPSLRKAVRGGEKLKGVSPELLDHWNNLQSEFDKAGIIPAIKSGYRTAEQQNALFTNPATHTRTKGNDGYINISPHQDRRALDVSFNAAQKATGHRIIADYAQRNNLYVPSDEPWHIAIPKATQKPEAIDPGLLNAGFDETPEVKTASTSVDPDLLAAGFTEQPSVTSALDKLTADINRRTAKIKAPTVSKADLEKPLYDAQRGQPATSSLSSDELRVMKGEQPGNRLAYQRQGELQERAGTKRPSEIYNTPQPNSIQARQLGIVERATEKIKEYAPGLASLDTPMGTKTDLLRGAASLGLADFSREVSPEERQLDPEAQQKADFAYGVGRAAPAVLPYAGAGKLAELAIPAATRAGAVGRTAATFGSVAAAREGVKALQGQHADPSEVVVSTALGAAMGGIAGVDPKLARQLVAFVTPQAVADYARGVPLGQAAQNAITNLLFGLHAGTSPKRLTAERIGELRKQLGGSRVSEVRNTFDAIKDGVPERPETITAQLEQRGYSLVPDGVPRPSIPRGFRAERTKDGVVYYDPKRISREEIKNTPTQELLGHVEPKSDTTTEAVVARKPDGTEIQASAVSPENVDKQVDVMAQQYPDAEIQTGGPEVARQVIGDRIESQRFQHLQFGEIEVAPDQSGARQNKVKVFEVANPDRQHFVAKADMQGRGNSRMIPIKPAEAQPAASPEIVRPEVAPQGTASHPVEPNVPPVPEGHTRFFRADHVDAEAPLGNGWAPRDPEYVSQKYGKGQMGSETIWYRDVPNSEIDAEYHDHRAVSILNTEALDRMKGSEPKLYRRVQPSPQVEAVKEQNQKLGEVGKDLATPPAELERQSFGSTPTIRRDSSNKTLSQAVRAAGGIKLDVDTANSGELARLSNRESATSGLVNNKNGTNAETMALNLAANGYRGDWVDVTRGPYGPKYDVDPNRFLEAVEMDQRGITPSFHGDKDFDYESEYRKEFPEESIAHDARIALIESDGGGQLYDKVIAGVASKSEIREFQKAAQNYGVSAEDAGHFIAEGERAKAQYVSNTAQRQEAEPSFVTAARERKANRLVEKEQGIEYRHSGIDPTPLLDDIVIRGHELYAQKVKPTFQEWSRKIREEFGPKADEHLRGVWSQLNGRTAESEDTTSIKNAAVEAAREVRDLPGLSPADHKSWEEAGERARAQGFDTPDKADAIAAQVVKGTKKQLTDEESAGLRDRLRGIENDYDILARATRGETDPEKIADSKAQGEALREKHRLLTDATKKAGTEIGRALAIRRSAVDQDMLLTQLGAERSYKLETGKEPTKEIQEQISKLVAENNRLKSEVDAHEERRKNDELSRAVEKTKRDASRELRQRGRQQTKAALDDELVDLKSQFAAAWKKVGRPTIQPMALDPEGELMKVVAKIVRNRVKANIGIKAEDLVDQVHGFLQDVADLDKRDVREMITGYGRKTGTRSELQKQLDALKSELYQGLAAEDVEAGKRSLRSEGPRLREGIGPKEGPQLGARQGPKNTWPARQKAIEKQIAEIERRIREKDFSEQPKRPAVIYDQKGNALRATLERVRRDFARLKDKNKQTTVADALVRWKRFAVLTYGTTVGKLTSAASGRMAMSPLYETAGQIGKHIPGLRSAFADEPSLKGYLKGEKAAISQLWQGDSFRDFISHLKGGEDLIELLYGEKGGDEFTQHSSGKTFIPKDVGEVLDRPGHIHAALKTVPKRAAFFRQFERGLQKEIEKPLDKQRDIRDPAVQLAIAGESNAYLESRRAILQQPNWVTTIFNNVVNAASRSDSRMARGFGKLLQYRYPITKVPVNYVGESAMHIAGLPMGIGEVATRGIANRVARPLLKTEAETRLGNIRRNLESRLPTAIEDLEPVQRQRIARAFKVGGIGLAFTVWGMMRPDQFGGYYQPGKRDSKDVKFGGMRFLGVNIPVWMGHIPPLEAAQFGSTLRRVYDSMQEKGKENSVLEATKAATKGLAGEIPFNDDSLVDVLLGGEGKGRKMLGGELRSNIPGFVQQAAKASDYPEGTSITDRLNPFGSKEAIKRQPETMGQEVKMGVPGLRQTVPINKLFGNQATKASNEVQRLKLDFKSAVKQPEESQDDFKVREERENRYIRKMLEAVVAKPEYQAESDENKIEWLKQAKEQAVQDAKDREKEKPEKPEKKEFPMPEVNYDEKPKGFKQAFLERSNRPNRFQQRLMQGVA